MELEIIYIDDYFVAVNKPSGLFVHKSDLDRNADYLLRIIRNQIGKFVYPVHRLDRPTSGVLLFALSSEASSKVCAQFRDKSVEKKYLAVVRGYTDNNGKINSPISPEKGKPKKDALTFYKKLSQIEIDKPCGKYESARYSLVQVTPVTGRMHQIRKHFKHIFHHLIGDTVYGDGKHNMFFRENYNIRRLLLTCYELNFFHPFLEKKIVLRAPLDDEMDLLFKKFGWKMPCI